MKVLITGATGLIGQALGLELVRRGHAIRALVRHPERAKQQMHFPCEILAWRDVANPPPAEAFREIDAVVHLAGESIAGRWTTARKQRIRDSRVLGTRHMVEALQQALKSGHLVRSFVLGSAIGYYGDCGDTWIDEIAPPGEDFLARVTAQWEAQAEPLSRDSQVRLVVIRTAVVLARNGGMLEKIRPLFTAGLGGRLSHGRQWMSWVHLDDIVGLFVHALENAQVRGVYNGAAPNPVTNADFTRALARALRVRTFLPVPAMALRILLGEMANSVLGGARASSRKVEDSGYQFRYPELTSALNQLYS